MTLSGLLFLLILHMQADARGRVRPPAAGNDDPNCPVRVTGRLVFPAYATPINHVSVIGYQRFCKISGPNCHDISNPVEVFTGPGGVFDFGMALGAWGYAVDVKSVEGMEPVHKEFDTPSNPGSRCIPGPGVRLEIVLHPESKVPKLSEDAVAIDSLASSPSRQTVEAFDKIVELRKPKTSDESQALLEILKSAPDYYDANLELGLDYKKDGQKDAAVGVLNHAVDINSGSMLARAALGEYSFESGDFAKAAELLEGATRLGNTSANVYYMLGVSYYKLGQFDLAEASLFRALDIPPGIGKAYLQLYNVYMKAKMPADALKSAQMYLTKYPDAEDRAYVQSMVNQLLKAMKPAPRN